MGSMYLREIFASFSWVSIEREIRVKEAYVPFNGGRFITTSRVSALRRVGIFECSMDVNSRCHIQTPHWPHFLRCGSYQVNLNLQSSLAHYNEITTNNTDISYVAGSEIY